MHELEVFFDCSSPWTYLGFESLQSLIIRQPLLQVTYKPILVGGVFNAVNPSVYENRANPVHAKQHYYAKDLQDWARHVGIVIGQPAVFPVNSVKAMRGAFYAMEENLLIEYARCVFSAYWTELRDISQDDELSKIITAVGLDPEVFFTKINDLAYKQRLKNNTEELIKRGGYGSPTFFLDQNDMYFGNDRIVLIEDRLNRTG
ncbi:MAG: 2-hydroxychromene-2-carboxylate isomerase [Patiriisocius sp.]|jgi:2-hydroxychromene-2-carboxylate isomerase